MAVSRGYLVGRCFWAPYGLWVFPGKGLDCVVGRTEGMGPVVLSAVWMGCGTA